MGLRSFLAAVGNGYNASEGFETPQQRLLLKASAELSPCGPPDFVVKASGGQRPLRTTDTPWIGFFDPDETTKPKEGLYVVYILQPDRESWTLSVNMGTENLAERMSKEPRRPGFSSIEKSICAAIADEAGAIRAGLSQHIRVGWEDSIDLKAGQLKSGMRQRRYEAGAVLGKSYPVDALPSEQVLLEDLDHLCTALQEAILVKHDLAVTRPGTISTASLTPTFTRSVDFVFAPGTDTAVYVELSGSGFHRSPRHEGGLRRYGTWLIARGFTPATNVHPRDLIVHGERDWLVEYKVVYGEDVARATREAHSQLKEYHYFLHSTDIDIGLLAVFSRSVSERRVAWLNNEDIAVVWNEADTWQGCPMAKAAGLGL